MNHSVSPELNKTLNQYDFDKQLQSHNLSLNRSKLTTLQLNLGRVCNQACHHCHVDASPKRTETMSERTMDRVIELIAQSPHVKTIDITGGAPEMNPYFRKLVQAASELEKQIIDRCNLTILLEPGNENLVSFLADHHVDLIASLPCYLEKNVDSQRGDGVFNQSIQALKQLNQRGYGKANTDLNLNLVYNPAGPSLPPPQKSLELDYKHQLKEHYDIEFNQLLTITNLPINRFAHHLVRNQQLNAYMNTLLHAFNPNTVERLMCRSLISVSWEGKLYDCDFNQMLNLPVTGRGKTLWDMDSLDTYQEPHIACGSHCFGCTAGSGSSCGGALLS
ncbi:arsenosugar biosynthesis radical SAM (seleno)protein ArsS [Deltaproteobacteria bacterium TL4]